MKKVLIIDDDDTNILALSAVLRSRDWQVETAKSADQGWEILNNEPVIAVILLDMMMPETDGYQMLKKLKNDNRHFRVPVIAVTAQAMKGDREKCLEAGADDYLPKPVDVDRLFMLLAQFTNQEYGI